MLNLEFKLKPSKQYLTLLFTVFVISMVIVLTLPLEWWIKLIGLLCLFLYGGRILWQFGLLRSKHSIISIRHHSDGRWLLHTHKKVYEAELRGDSTVTGWVSILRFRILKRFWPKSCVVFRDSLRTDDYRKLLVVLRGINLKME